MTGVMTELREPTGFVSVEVLARSLSLPRRFIVSEADADHIPFLHVGRRRLFNVGAVRDALLHRSSLAEGADDTAT